jgi:hypothetical protein
MGARAELYAATVTRFSPRFGYFCELPPRSQGLNAKSTAIQSYISIEVQLLAVTVTETVLKTLPSTLKFWSLACITECRVVSTITTESFFIRSVARLDLTPPSRLGREHNEAG